MPYLILGVAVVIGLVLIVRGLAASEPQRAWAVVKVLAIAIGVAGVIYFAATRGIGTTLITLALLGPILLRWRGIGRLMRNMRGPSPGQTSDVETAFLRMSLDHDSGVLDGTVLRGRFRGRSRLAAIDMPLKRGEIALQTLDSIEQILHLIVLGVGAGAGKRDHASGQA